MFMKKYYATFLFLCSPSLLASVFQCQLPNGHMAFQDKPCEQKGVVESQIETLEDRANKKASKELQATVISQCHQRIDSTRHQMTPSDRQLIDQKGMPYCECLAKNVYSVENIEVLKKQIANAKSKDEVELALKQKIDYYDVKCRTEVGIPSEKEMMAKHTNTITQDEVPRSYSSGNETTNSNQASQSTQSSGVGSSLLRLLLKRRR
jgi:hypothetical protein